MKIENKTCGHVVGELKLHDQVTVLCLKCNGPLPENKLELWLQPLDDGFILGLEAHCQKCNEHQTVKIIAPPPSEARDYQ